MRLSRADSGGLPLGSEVAALLGPLLDPAFPLPPRLDIPIACLCAPERAEAGSLVCVGSRIRLSVREAWAKPPVDGPVSEAGTTEPRAARPVLIAAEAGVQLPPLDIPVLRIRSAQAAVAALLAAWSHRWEREAPFAPGPGNRIAPTAVVEGCLEGDVEVGPGAYVAKGAFIGRRTRIGANAVIEAHCHIGRDCEIQPGVVIGCAGFGFYARPSAARLPADRPSAAISSSDRPPEGPQQAAASAPSPRAQSAGPDLLPMPHPAGVRIGDGCFIGANTVVAAGVLHPTGLGRGCKLDSHVQIAHNVILGEDCLLASQSGVAGSTEAGARLRLGGAASVDGHLRLGNDVSVAACSGVTKDFPDGSIVAGFPAQPIAAWRKSRIGERRKGPVPGPEILAGLGVHSGRHCRLEIGLRDAARSADGPVFVFPGFPGPLTLDDLARLPRAARWATVLGNIPATVATPEHLLAALLFFADAPLSLRADASELPGLDGSALPYREALSRLSPASARAPAWREYPCGLAWEDDWDDGHLSIRPADRFRVRYVLERGPLRQAFVLEDAAAAWREILPARTFAFHGEWRAATDGGLMAGAGRDSGLLLAATETEYRAVLALHPEWEGGPYPLLNQPAWRVPDEPVKHKILDLLGDLALNGLALPRAEIEVRNGGHSAHHRLLARLREC